MSRDRAIRTLAERLAREPDLEGPALDELCRAHPDLEADLRDLAQRRAATESEAPRVPCSDGRRLHREVASRLRYVLLGEVSKGAGGSVLQVWDTVLERPLAMKVLDLRALRDDREAAEETLRRFLAEARIAGSLQHPGVVPIHDLGADRRGLVYFTMPFFEGLTLEDAFEKARSNSEGWSLGRALLVLAKACEVVAYAHSRGVVHRDLKPSNLIAGLFGEVYVVDWGLAKSLEEPEPAAEEPAEEIKPAEPGRTLDGTIAGTPTYMAPEQAEGRVADITHKVDVYALGAMLYRLLGGRAPYAPRHGHDEPAKTVELIRRGSPTPVARLAPDAPEELVRICERAMARAPEERYRSVEELAGDLLAFLEGRVLQPAGDGARR